MTYEVIHGEQPTEYVDAASPYQACLKVWRDEVKNDVLEMAPFQVLALNEDGGVAEDIPLETIVQLQHLAVNGEEPEGQIALAMSNLEEGFWDWSTPEQ
jgi:predicted phage-related endonuclease